MLTHKARHLVMQAQKGSGRAREQLLVKHRNFVAKVCSNVCNKHLAWENDEELSIGLMALNEAIDAFDVKAKVQFTTFARTVIKRRLIDYLRSQTKYTNEQLNTFRDDIDELEAASNARSQDIYRENRYHENLAELMEYYAARLDEFDIDINQLHKISPKHKDTRDSLFKAALTIKQDKMMMRYLLRYGHLPIKSLSPACNLSRKVLEKGRKYIIALVLILIDPRLAPLQSFTTYPTHEERISI